MKINKYIVRCLPKTLHWTLHNTVGHPAMEILKVSSVLLVKVSGRGKSLNNWSNWVHDITIPEEL